MAEQRFRVRAEFDVVVPEGREADATQWAERVWAALARDQVQQGASVRTSGGSPEVVVRTMLDDPAQRATMLGVVLLVLGQTATEHAIRAEHFRLEPS